MGKKNKDIESSSESDHEDHQGRQPPPADTTLSYQYRYNQIFCSIEQLYFNMDSFNHGSGRGVYVPLQLDKAEENVAQHMVTNLSTTRRSRPHVPPNKHQNYSWTLPTSNRQSGQASLSSIKALLCSKI